MDIKDLVPFVLLLIFTGMLLGVGMIVFSNLGDASRSEINVVNENHTFSVNTATSLSYVTEVTESSIAVANKSTTQLLTLGRDYNVTVTASTATILVTQFYNNTQLDVDYTYYVDREASTQMDNMITAVAPIASTWMSLIVTIVVLALVLGIVIKSFRGGR